jgi:hypothetical protein
VSSSEQKNLSYVASFSIEYIEITKKNPNDTLLKSCLKINKYNFNLKIKQLDTTCGGVYKNV